MQAGHGEMEGAELGATGADGELAFGRGQDDVFDFEIDLRGASVGDGAAANGGEDLLDVFIFNAEDRRAIERNFIDELGEGVLNIGESRVMIQMLAVDVGDYGDDGRELKKRSVAFVRFDHQNGAFAHARVRALESGDAATHDDGGVEIRGVQNGGDHRRGGGFPMAAGD